MYKFSSSIVGFKRPTAGVPAAGENQLTKRATAKAQNQLQKRAESQPSGARFVGQFLCLPRPVTEQPY